MGGLTSSRVYLNEETMSIEDKAEKPISKSGEKESLLDHGSLDACFLRVLVFDSNLLQVKCR